MQCSPGSDRVKRLIIILEDFQIAKMIENMEGPRDDGCCRHCAPSCSRAIRGGSVLILIRDIVEYGRVDLNGRIVEKAEHFLKEERRRKECPVVPQVRIRIAGKLGARTPMVHDNDDQQHVEGVLFILEPCHHIAKFGIHIRP